MVTVRGVNKGLALNSSSVPTLVDAHVVAVPAITRRAASGG